MACVNEPDKGADMAARLHPFTGKPLNPIYVSPRTGRMWWPILGGSEPPPAPPAPSPPAPPTPSPPAPAADSFPANTPLEQMTTAQQAAYWKHQARKHEDRSKSADAILSTLGVKSADDAASAKAKIEKHDALEFELASEADKKAVAAKADAEKAANEKYQPLLVRAEFKAAAAGRIDDEKLTTILEPLNMSVFLAADGTPDAAKVKAYVDGIAPVMGTPPPRLGPTPSGQGSQQGGTRSAAGAQTVTAGRDLYAQLHVKK